MSNETKQIYNYINIGTTHTYYINNSFSALVKGFADWFKNDMYQRSTDVVIGTYEKAFEYYRRKKEDAGYSWINKYPFLSLDPVLDFEPDDQTVLGRGFTSYPNYERNLTAELYKPYIYQDENVTVSAGLNRYKGTMELTIWCSSVYELIDMRTLTYQTFGGLNRYIYPKEIYGQFTLPDEILYFEHNNILTGTNYILDWDNSTAESVLIKNINRNKYVYPFSVLPYIKLSSVSDSSDRYGGSGDELSEHKLTVTIEWECSIPTHLILISKNLPEKTHDIVMDITVSYKYFPDIEEEVVRKVPNEHSVVYINSEETAKSKFLMYKTYYNYTLTDEDVQKSSLKENIEIDLIDPVDDIIYLAMYGKGGKFKEDFHWKLNDTKDKIIFYGFLFEEGYYIEDDILKIIYYKDMV